MIDVISLDRILGSSERLINNQLTQGNFCNTPTAERTEALETLIQIRSLRASLGFMCTCRIPNGCENKGTSTQMMDDLKPIIDIANSLLQPNRVQEKNECPATPIVEVDETDTPSDQAHI